MKIHNYYFLYFLFPSSSGFVASATADAAAATDEAILLTPVVTFVLTPS